ncbi:MAG: cytochrome-c oxidase, cbb3-type subunit II [Alcanivorax sp.]|nr:cytochrome-c oxidase, cbb3-type subunit II [Alcanivorax sp.]
MAGSAHEKVEKNVGLLIALVLVAVSFGGLAEIVPLLKDDGTTQPIKGLQPYTALELEGRDVYIREGCHVCHTQMVRPLRAETERYGPYSVAGEDVWEHPFLWGSKRTGPDLARVGGRYSDEWHRDHLYAPRDLVPESNMPAYPWLRYRQVNWRHTERKLNAMRMLGVPYSDDDIAEQLQRIARDWADKTEEDALVAYLQQLGTVRTGRSAP